MAIMCIMYFTSPLPFTSSPVVPLIPVLIPMIVDLVDGTELDTDLIITRNYNYTTDTLSGL